MNISKIIPLAITIIASSAFAMDAPQDFKTLLQQEQQKAQARLASIMKQLELIKQKEQLEAQLKALDTQVAEGNQQLGLSQAIPVKPKESPSLNDLAFIADEKINKDQEKEQLVQEKEKPGQERKIQGQKRKRAQSKKQTPRKKTKDNTSISLECPECQHKYYGDHALRSLGRHMRDKHSKYVNNEKIICNLCKIETGDSKQMYNHMIDAHINLKCSECNSSFSNQKEFNKHIKTSHQDKAQEEVDPETDDETRPTESFSFDTYV